MSVRTIHAPLQLEGGATSGFPTKVVFSPGSVLSDNGDGTFTVTIPSTGVSIGSTITGGTQGSILFIDPTNTLAQDNPNLFWDNTNNRLGIGTNSPTNKIHVLDTNTTINANYTGSLFSHYYNANTSIIGGRTEKGVAFEFFTGGTILGSRTRTNNGIYSSVSSSETVSGQLTSYGVNSSANFSGSATGDTTMVGVLGVSGGDMPTSGALYTHTGIQASVTGTGSVSYGAFLDVSGATINYGVYAVSDINYFSGDVGIGSTSPSEKLDVSGNIQLKAAGNGFKVKEGSNATMGIATMVAGTVTVSTTKVTANSRIFLTPQNASGTAGSVSVSARTASTSFVISSTNILDTRDVAWLIMEPA